MKVVITQDGLYADFQRRDGMTKSGAMERAVGDEMEYPPWYAQSIVDSGLAKFWQEPEPEEAPEIEATRGAVELAEQEGVDLATVDGTGKGSKVTLTDVRAAITTRGEQQ